ncbi:MAG: long-chain acyl-CoA synthetase, partial [Candidatus Azotimanducaceae bacterium]
SHPDVSLCAVIGRSTAGDEEIVAYIQPVEGKLLDVDAILAFSRERLTGYKVPTQIVIKAQLPTAPSGKILKHQLMKDEAS